MYILKIHPHKKQNKTQTQHCIPSSSWGQDARENETWQMLVTSLKALLEGKYHGDEGGARTHLEQDRCKVGRLLYMWLYFNEWSDSLICFIFILLCSMLLLNYLGQTGRETPLMAAAIFSAGWNVFESAESLEKPLNWLLFNYYLTTCLQSSINRWVTFWTIQKGWRC